MTAAASGDEDKLQAFYETQAKYHPDPVPTPLDRATAIRFVVARVSRTTAPDKMRKLVRLAVFYDLRETASAFSGMLMGGETQSEDIIRSSLCLVALAWIGDPGQQAAARQYYHELQNRANVDLHRDIMLEVVEAFGPAEGTGYFKQWVQAAIRSLEHRLEQEQAAKNIPAIKNLQEKANELTEYLNLNVARVDRTFALRQRIEGDAPANRVVPLVTFSLATTPEATPALSYWASMQLLRLALAVRQAIAAEFIGQASALTRPGQELYRARALRAAEFFGVAPLPDREWLATQPDPGTDPLVLRPAFYLKKLR